MSLDNHDPRERAAVRDAMKALRRSTGSDAMHAKINLFLDDHPELPPLPTIERWVGMVDGRSASWPFPPEAKHLLEAKLPDTARVFRLEPVEEVTPTPERVTLEGVVWERNHDARWHSATHGVVQRQSNLSDALDLCLSQAKRIAELEKGAGK